MSHLRSQKRQKSMFTDRRVTHLRSWDQRAMPIQGGYKSMFNEALRSLQSNSTLVKRNCTGCVCEESSVLVGTLKLSWNSREVILPKESLLTLKKTPLNKILFKRVLFSLKMCTLGELYCRTRNKQRECALRELSIISSLTLEQGEAWFYAQLLAFSCHEESFYYFNMQILAWSPILEDFPWSFQKVGSLHHL